MRRTVSEGERHNRTPDHGTPFCLNEIGKLNAGCGNAWHTRTRTPGTRLHRSMEGWADWGWRGMRMAESPESGRGRDVASPRGVFVIASSFDQGWRRHAWVVRMHHRRTSRPCERFQGASVIFGWHADALAAMRVHRVTAVTKPCQQSGTTREDGEDLLACGRDGRTIAAGDPSSSPRCAICVETCA